MGGLIAASLTHSAYAQEPIAGRVIIMVASEKPGRVDPRLSAIPSLLAAFKKAPLNAYQSIEMEGQPTALRMRLKKAEEVELPNGRKLRLEVEKINTDGTFLVSASLQRPGQNKYTLLLRVTEVPGKPFIVAGQPYKGGTLFIGVILGETKGS